MDAKRVYFDRFPRWWETPDFSNVLAASIEESRGFDLRFVDQTDLAQVVREDYREAQRAYESRSYKATIVLCGSILEALLVASVAKASDTITERDLYNSNLDELLSKANQLELINDRAVGDLLKPLRLYRNLIHPGRQLRLEIRPDEHKAQIALRTVRLLVEELRRAFELDEDT